MFASFAHTIIYSIARFFTFRKTVRKFSKVKKCKFFMTVQLWTLRLLFIFGMRVLPRWGRSHLQHLSAPRPPPPFV